MKRVIRRNTDGKIVETKKVKDDYQLQELEAFNHFLEIDIEEPTFIDPFKVINDKLDRIISKINA